MAKLTGVKTLDMVNGEIKKVAYNGAEYIKVDGPAQVGDLALRLPIANNLDITAGHFYEVAKVYKDDVMISDDADDLTVRKQSKFIFFRKKGAVEYVKVTDRDPRVGDYIKFNDDSVAGISYLTTGKYYPIIEIDISGDPQILDDEGETFDTFGEDYDVYERVGAFEEGDYVKITDNFGDHNFKIGEVVRVRALQEDVTHKCRIIGENLDGSKYGYVYINDFVKASSEEVAEAKRAAKWAKLGRKPNEFKQGDIVRIISAGFSDLRNGELGIVGEIYGYLLRVCGRLDSANWVSADNVELVAPAESRVDVE